MARIIFLTCFWLALTGPARAEVKATFLGVSSILFQDGKDSILIDGYFSRLSWDKVLLQKIKSDQQRVAKVLDRLGDHKIRAVIVAHAHFDHALDSAVVAEKTRAKLFGTRATNNIRLPNGKPYPLEQIIDGKPLKTETDFTVTAIASPHSTTNWFAGNIPHPMTPPAHVIRYLDNDNFSFLIEHPSPSKIKILVHPSANFTPGKMKDVKADIVFLGIGQMGRKSKAFVCNYWKEIIETTGATQVIPVHWDNFFRPLEMGPDKPLKPMTLDGIEKTMARLRVLADQQQVDFRVMQAFNVLAMESNSARPPSRKIQQCPL